MSPRSLLDALDMVLREVANGDRHHLSPPAEGQVVTAKPLMERGIYHRGHFSHQNRDKHASDDRTRIDVNGARGVADKVATNPLQVSLAEEEGGKGGERAKTRPAAIAYPSPPACGVVASGGESGQSRTPTLLARLGQALRAEASGTAASAPISRVAHRHDRLSRWLREHPPPPCPPDRCAHCGGEIGERAHDAVPVLHTIRPPAPLWLHLTCSYTWHEQRMAAAAAALSDETAPGEPA